MSAMTFPKIAVQFDDGRSVEIQVRQSDMVRLERDEGKAISDITFGVATIMRLAWLACRRLKVDGVDDNFDDFMDAVEVEMDVTGPKA